MTARDKAKNISLRKSGKKITALTAYDFSTAKLLDDAGVDVLLVGDSLGMVVLGFPDTTHVTLAHMLHHTEAVARAHPRALIIGDMPIHTYDSVPEAMKTAKLLIAAGADAVKLEGGVDQIKKVTAIIAENIPVIGHIGMLPQHVVEEGGYRKKGKTEASAAALIEDAISLTKAGVSAIVLESIVPSIAQKITDTISVPTIGIGCGENTCDGEVAVITDVIGSYPWFVPPFAKPYANVASQISEAVKKYIARVQQ